jgi:hypothetical protein
MPNSTASKYLIGMKNDVPLAERVVTRDMAEESAKNKGYKYFECSAKTSYGQGLDGVMS